jgi:hypothetical protein
MRAKRAFTLLELQVGLVLLTMGFMTLASLLATQTRMQKRLERGFGQGATVYLTQSKDPWVKQLGAPARITTAAINSTAPTAISVSNDVAIVQQQRDLAAETQIVTVDIAPVD